VLLLRDLTRLGEPGYEAGDAAIRARLPHALLDGGRLLEVFNKADLVPAGAVPAGALAISAQTGAGLDALRRRLLELAGWHAPPEGVFIARTRHVQALRRCATHLVAAAEHAMAGDRVLELLAEELRAAHDALGEITGATTADDLLGEIFGRFCIGK
jgi:tRNA modification GTPase